MPSQGVFQRPDGMLIDLILTQQCMKVNTHAVFVFLGKTLVFVTQTLYHLV